MIDSAGTYVYATDGRKLSVEHVVGIVNNRPYRPGGPRYIPARRIMADRTEYLGNFVFENGCLSKVLFDEGFISFKENIKITNHTLINIMFKFLTGKV